MSDPKWEQVVDAPKHVQSWVLRLGVSTLHLYQPVGMRARWVVCAKGKLKTKEHDINGKDLVEAQTNAVMYYLDLLSKASLEATGALRGMMMKRCGEPPSC